MGLRGMLMKKLTARIVLSMSIMMLAACSSSTTKPLDDTLNPNSTGLVANKVLQASGYSALRIQPQLTQLQNQYAVEQSAKMNAYRGLAKQIYREQLFEGRVVADQVISDDVFRIYLDLFLREARVVESRTIADQQKIALELDLTPRFYQCFSATVAVVSRCLWEDNKIPFTRTGYKKAPMTTVNLACSDCADQLSVAGFSKEKNSVDNALLNAGVYDAEWVVNMGIKTLFNYLILTQVLFD